MLVILDKNLFRYLYHWKWENKLKLTPFQNLLEMNWNKSKLIWSNLSEIPLMSDWYACILYIQKKMTQNNPHGVFLIMKSHTQPVLACYLFRVKSK